MKSLSYSRGRKFAEARPDRISAPARKVIHTLSHAASARKFVAPMVDALCSHGYDAVLETAETGISRNWLATVFSGMTISANPIVSCGRIIYWCYHLAREQPNIMHAHQTQGAIIPLFAARVVGVPNIIYHNHGLPYLGYRGVLRWILWLFDAANCRLADSVYMVSGSNLAAARSDYVLPPGRGSLLGYGTAVGIDLEEYPLEMFTDTARRRARTALEIRDSACVFLYVGRPVRRKGFGLMLNAWKASGLADTGHCLLIAGCTQSDCDRFGGKGIAGISCLGFVPDLRETYAAADVVVLPSAHEGFPYALLEAAASGRAAIGTDIPGTRCAIDPGVTGLMVPWDDIAALVAALLLLARDPVLRASFGAAARSRVVSRFDRRYVISAMLKEYKHMSNASL